MGCEILLQGLDALDVEQTYEGDEHQRGILDLGWGLPDDSAHRIAGEEGLGPEGVHREETIVDDVIPHHSAMGCRRCERIERRARGIVVAA